jgi:hypothetical protein
MYCTKKNLATLVQATEPGTDVTILKLVPLKKGEKPYSFKFQIAINYVHGYVCMYIHEMAYLKKIVA